MCESLKSENRRGTVAVKLCVLTFTGQTLQYNGEWAIRTASTVQLGPCNHGRVHTVVKVLPAGQPGLRIPVQLRSTALWNLEL